MPRFVVLDHDHPFRHWDLMLEAGGVLRTWRLFAEPSPGATVPAEPLPDHRTHYLNYEGPVSGDRGTVVRWDAGAFDWVRDDADAVEIDVRGAKYRGRVALTQTTATFT